MSPSEAEATLALAVEVNTALELVDDEPAFREDWRIQFAAERVIERIFQAAEVVTVQQREDYFGTDGLRFLRGMRNRLAHNYLDIDLGILWDTLSTDLPIVRDRLASDAEAAAELLRRTGSADDADDPGWPGSHLRRTQD